MIVRDEEKSLPRCLQSVQEVANELIVVDTGSKDGTASTAKDYGARVYHFEWCDDFSAARNEYLKHVTGDWILQMDADEELSRASIQPLKNAILNPWRLGYLVKHDNGPEAFQRFALTGRLFRNHPLLRYSRPYHEGLDQALKQVMSEEPRWEIGNEPGIIIRHYGYGANQFHDKLGRGIRIMEPYVKQHPEDWYVWNKLGSSYADLGDYQKAEQCLARGLRMNPDCAEGNYALGYVKDKQNKLDEAIPLYKRAIDGQPLLAEARARLGAIYVEKRNFFAAIMALQGAVGINPDLAGAYVNLGLAYIGLQRYDEGIGQLKKAIAKRPGFSAAHMNLAMAYTKKEMMDEAIAEYKTALKIEPNYAKAHYNLAVTYYKTGNYKKAIEHCDKAAALGAKIHTQFLDWLKPHRN